jgi:hypothetical protein
MPTVLFIQFCQMIPFTAEGLTAAPRRRQAAFRLDIFLSPDAQGHVASGARSRERSGAWYWSRHGHLSILATHL